ncbi:DUF3347 domain-containing protein [Salinimicrobium flavum]|uniref:DUF3347 domain-containing protein n=1 Tax=Salinimicrobium flavum TaxID=1737065 RepID=A0ABW5IU01_9FLAO
MKNARLLLMAFLGAITLNSCGETKKENETEEASMPMQNEMHMEGDEMQEMGDMQEGNLDDGAQGDIAFNNQNMEAVYNHYVHIKTALVNTNAEEAQNGAKMMTEALQSAGGNEKVLNAAQKIAQTDDINVQRTTFQDLSAAMENMLSGQLSSGEVYKQFCPMAFEGKGAYWLSSSEEIRNPYYGDKMLKCGSVRDTIK